MSSDPIGVPVALSIGRATLRKMRQNLARAIGYNSIALPIAAGVFAPLGLVLPPEIAALSMSGSSALVAVNALLRRRSAKPDACGDRSLSAEPAERSVRRPGTGNALTAATVRGGRALACGGWRRCPTTLPARRPWRVRHLARAPVPARAAGWPSCRQDRTSARPPPA
jgi:hypothetical protein